MQTVEKLNSSWFVPNIKILVCDEAKLMSIAVNIFNGILMYYIGKLFLILYLIYWQVLLQVVLLQPCCKQVLRREYSQWIRFSLFYHFICFEGLTTFFTIVPLIQAIRFPMNCIFFFANLASHKIMHIEGHKVSWIVHRPPNRAEFSSKVFLLYAIILCSDFLLDMVWLGLVKSLESLCNRHLGFMNTSSTVQPLMLMVLIFVIMLDVMSE
jgi:hypothetical protein